MNPLVRLKEEAGRMKSDFRVRELGYAPSDAGFFATMKGNIMNTIEGKIVTQKFNDGSKYEVILFN